MGRPNRLPFHIMETFLSDARNYGWLGVLILWSLDKLFPRLWTFLTDRVFPARAKERAEKRDQEEKVLNARLDQERKEQDYRQKLEERTTRAIEQMATNQAATNSAIAVNNERMGTLIAGFVQLQGYIVSAVQDMRLTTQQFHGEAHKPSKRTKKVKPSP